MEMDTGEPMEGQKKQPEQQKRDTGAEKKPEGTAKQLRLTNTF